MSARAHGRRYLGLLSAGAALSALVLSPVLTGTAHAGSLPAPAFASVAVNDSDVVTSPVDGTSKPTVITQTGSVVHVTVSLWTSSAKTSPAAFNKDTDFTLTSGGVSVTRTFAANQSSQDFDTAPLGAAVNQTAVSVSFPSLKGKSAVPAASSPTVFDVLSFVVADTAGAGYTRNVGKGGASCGEVTAQQPFCATVLLPKGAGSIVLGTGACDDTTYTDCASKKNSFVLELLADLEGAGYSPTEPATVILSCDKIYCGNGAIKNNVPHFTTEGNAALENVPACTAKGVAPGPDALFAACVDYVQSTRDNAGDTHLWLLFARDSRMSCC
jgi:hypothetical protein